MEQLAIRSLNSLNTAPYLEGILVLIILAAAGLAAVKTTAFDYTLKRAPFFLAQSILLTIMSFINLMALAIPSAIANSFLWLLLFGYFALYALVGYIWGIIAAARSVDGYGDRWHWFYSIIPLVNLALIFKSSQQSADKSSFVSKVAAVAMVFLSFIVFGIGKAVDKAAEREVDLLAQQIQSDPGATSKVVDAAVRSDGIESVLKLAIAEIKVPRQVDTITTLTTVEVIGRTLHYGYTISGQPRPLTEESKTAIAKQLCGNELKPFMDGGATLRASYIDTNNYYLGEVNVNSELCAKFI